MNFSTYIFKISEILNNFDIDRIFYQISFNV